MSLVKRPRPTIIIGGDELNGLLNLFDARLNELSMTVNNQLFDFYVGAYYALETIIDQDYIKYPIDFMALFAQKIENCKKEVS